MNFQPANADGTKVFYPRLDVTDARSVRDLAETVRRDGDGNGKVDVLINNAGVNLDRPYTIENVRKTFEVNFGGVREVCRLLSVSWSKSLILILIMLTTTSDVPNIHPAHEPHGPNCQHLFHCLAAEKLLARDPGTLPKSQHYSS